MKKGQTKMLVVIVIVTMAIIILLVVGYVAFHPCEKETYIIEDIIQISQGGFMSPNKCIFMTDKGKMIFDRLDCNKQIGEEITKRK